MEKEYQLYITIEGGGEDGMDRVFPGIPFKSGLHTVEGLSNLDIEVCPEDAHEGQKVILTHSELRTVKNRNKGKNRKSMVNAKRIQEGYIPRRVVRFPLSSQSEKVSEIKQKRGKGTEAHIIFTRVKV